METQYQITEWALNTFGTQPTVAIAARMNNEVSELLTGLTHEPDNTVELLAECADIYIMLAQVATSLGGDLAEEVAKKMVINAERTWTKTASGKVQHV